MNRLARIKETVIAPTQVMSLEHDRGNVAGNDYYCLQFTQMPRGQGFPTDFISRV